MPDISAQLKNKINALPDTPGAYLMKNRKGEVIYIGKARSLRKRVASYFNRTERDPKTSALVKNIDSIDYIATDSEIEALLLENTLIKENRPRFNVRLKDDKRYPYIAVTLAEDYPRVIFTRKLSDPSNRYFGPYTDARAARNIVETINRIFKLKTCTRELPLRENERPCINFQMKRCQGVCQNLITGEEYRMIVDSAISFLEGNIEPLQKNLREQMDFYSRSMEYEKAARIRDIIYDIQKYAESQKVLAPVEQDLDYIALTIDAAEAIVIVFEFRNGALLGRKVSVIGNTRYSQPGEILKTFIVDFYRKQFDTSREDGEESARSIPEGIITQHPLEDRKLIEEHLSTMAAKRIRIGTPATPDDRGIINMILKNIAMLIAERKADRERADRRAGLQELRKILSLERPPETIECFDISNIQGTKAVASMVRFSRGNPDRSSYRRYRIRGYDAANDPGMIHEVVGRRVQYLINEHHELPDLMVIDGGKPQLSRAQEIISDFNLDTKIIALAKRFEEIYYDPGTEPLRLPASSEALKILQRIRDEAHRFAITYHRKLREKELKSSLLDEIPDIGEKKKKLLLQHLGSVEKISRAGIEELAVVPGIGKETARKIHRFFRER